MNGRALSAIMLLLVLLAAGLVSTPALSGEHPWDSDITGDEQTHADYEWDTRAQDSAQLDVESEAVDTPDSSGDGTSSSVRSFVFGVFGALTIGF
ncbi:MAG: hypothetical protein GY867_07940 [bacterium]|nr:hypothetical protein [bacterium]